MHSLPPTTIMLHRWCNCMHHHTAWMDRMTTKMMVANTHLLAMTITPPDTLDQPNNPSSTPEIHHWIIPPINMTPNWTPTMTTMMMTQPFLHHFQTLDHFQNHLQLLIQSLDWLTDFLACINNPLQLCDQPMTGRLVVTPTNHTTTQYQPPTSPCSPIMTQQLSVSDNPTSTQCIPQTHLILPQYLIIKTPVPHTTMILSIHNITPATPKWAHQTPTIPKVPLLYHQPSLSTICCKPHTSHSFMAALLCMANHNYQLP